MRKTLLIFLFLGSLLACDSLQAQQLTFDKLEADFGSIAKGKVIEVPFIFTNNDTRPIVVGQVQTSCGCTATQWTRTPIAPGASGELRITYDTGLKDQTGAQTKVVIVIYNYADASPESSREEKIVLRGTVEQ